MGAGNWSQHGDQNGKNGACRQGVADQRKRVIPGGEVLGHDAGADNGGEQK